MKQRLPFIYRMIRGAIGKRFVIKHYSYGIVKTKYPDMKDILPSEAQKMRRRFFRQAVKYAQAIYANPELKEKKRRMMRKPKRLFQALMKEWFKQRAERAFLNQRRLRIWQEKVKINACVKEKLFQVVAERSLHLSHFQKPSLQLE